MCASAEGGAAQRSSLPVTKVAAVLVLCGPRVLLETAEGMVEDWLQS